MQFFLVIATGIVSCAFVCSCAREQKVTYKKAELGGIRKYESTVEFKTGENGEAVWKNSKRSHFESQAGFGGKSEFAGKSYTKNDFKKEKWNQNTTFDAQSYAGNTDAAKYKQVPHFADQKAAFSDKTSNLAQRDYGTNGYSGATQQVDRGRQFGKHEDVQTSKRRQVYQEPTIQSSEEYNGLSLDESNSLLGR